MLDDDAAPESGLEPDTAADAAGEQDTSGSADTSVDAAGPPPDGRVVLDGPAAENEDISRATADLQSSRDKSAQAQEIADDLAAKTLPESKPRG